MHRVTSRTPLELLVLVFCHALVSGACDAGDEILQPVSHVGSSTGGVGGTGGAGGASDGGAGGSVLLLDGPCDPLVPSQCGYPFPSNVYLVADANMPSGHRVAFPKEALPVVVGHGAIDPTPFNRSDGFSPGQAPLTDLPGATLTGLPTQDSIDASLAPDSPTILLEADTGERVPHFAELDVSAASSEGDRAFMIRPVVRLKDATRYIVAIRHVVDQQGKALAPSLAFQALRDGTPSGEGSVERRRGLYADIFATLQKAGIAKHDLQIAWDYTTASRDNNTRALLPMRDDALAWVGAEGPAYAIDQVDKPTNSAFIYERIRGHMTVPLYLDKVGPGGHLALGADGLPKRIGTADIPFLVHVPHAALKGMPLAILMNGHGLLGDKTEGQNTYLAEMCDKNGFVGVTIDLIGMAQEDADSMMAVFGGDIGAFDHLVERQHQGILNSLLAMRMMKGRFWKDSHLQLKGVPIIDPTQVYYRGDGQGGIFGATIMALSTDATRGLLGGSGMPYNLLIQRSADFVPFVALLRGAYRSGRELQTVLGLLQMVWDRTEADGYAPYIVDPRLPGTPTHQILLQDAIGDHQVTTLGAHILARAVKANNLKPTLREVYGIPPVDAPFTGSGLVEWTFGVNEAPKTNVPPPEEMPNDPLTHDPHGWVRQLAPARDQAAQFFRTGTLMQSCTGACVFSPL